MKVNLNEIIDELNERYGNLLDEEETKAEAIQEFYDWLVEKYVD